MARISVQDVIDQLMKVKDKTVNITLNIELKSTGNHVCCNEFDVETLHNDGRLHLVVLGGKEIKKYSKDN